MCRYCNANSDVKEMCVECKRRYNRLSLNKSKLLKLFSSADIAKVENKILDDLAVYRQLQSNGCVVPPVVAATLEQFKHVQRPGIICGYCGRKVSLLHKGTRQCEDCYKFYNYFGVLYYGPKRPCAVKTRQAYVDMLLDIEERRDAGLKIPGVAVRALQEEQHMLKIHRTKEVTKNDSSMETRTERRTETNPSIKRKTEPIS